MIIKMAKLGLSPSGDATQALARTRDAVGYFYSFIIGLFSPTRYRSRYLESGTHTPEFLNHLSALDTTAHRATLLTRRSRALAALITHHKNHFRVVAFLMFLLLVTVCPTSSNAAWVYIPSSGVSKIYATGSTLSGNFWVGSVPIGTMVFDLTSKSFVDIASLPVASQPPLNPIMLGMPTINYGGLPSALDPLNPANAVDIGKKFAEYGSYMLGVSLIGLFLGMSFGGLLGLIRRNTQVI